MTSTQRMEHLMSYDYTQLPHAGIRSLAPYIPGKSAEALAEEQGLTDILKLASNENPLGCSPSVNRALAEITGHQIATYTVSTQHPLREKLAQRLALNKEMLLLSNGSDAIFHLLLVCFALHTDKHILTHDYAFISYEIQAKTLGVDTRKVRLMPNWQVDIDAMIQACTEDTALIFIANPNNPTGVLISSTEINRLLSHIPVTTILVLDEAYHEYLAVTDEFSHDLLLTKYPNLVITRTFSKAYGLAALRLGYALANPAIIALLYQIQLPFFVNQAVMLAASAALDDQHFIHETVQLNAAGRTQMQAGFDALELAYIPSACNFITVDCGYSATAIDKRLQQEGIIVRPLTPYGLNRHLRVTIGTSKQNTRFLQTFKRCLILEGASLDPAAEQ